MDLDRPANSDLHDLLAQARAGSREAVVKLFEAHRQAVRLVIRKRLTQPLRRIFDSVDFTQEVAVKVWTHTIPPEVFASDPEFHAYLTTMAKNILHDFQRRYLQSQRHNLHREISGADIRETPAPADAPKASENLDEWFEQKIKELPPVYRRIMLLTRAGYHQSEIAAQLRISERTVRRVVRGFSKSPPPPILP